MAFADTLRVLNTMRAEGVIEEYALAGAMAIVFWTEPVPTWDLDVLVFLPSAPGPLVSLDGIHRWTSAHGYPIHKEHVIIEGVPTQFLASAGQLGDEAIQTAATSNTTVSRRESSFRSISSLCTSNQRLERRNDANARPCSWSGLA
jgi:hypothetical protein